MLKIDNGGKLEEQSLNQGSRESELGGKKKYIFSHCLYLTVVFQKINSLQTLKLSYFISS